VSRPLSALAGRLRRAATSTSDGLLSVFSSASRGPVPDNHNDEEHDHGNHPYGGDGESKDHALHLECPVAGLAEETATWRVVRLVVYALGTALLTVHFISCPSTTKFTRRARLMLTSKRTLPPARVQRLVRRKDGLTRRLVRAKETLSSIPKSKTRLYDGW